MKKFLSIILSLVLLFSLVSLVGCGGKSDDKDIADTSKFGMGSYSYVEGTSSADADTNGKGQYVTTVAAVLLDGDGKIVKAVIDSADNTVEFTSTGKAVTASEFKTKYELKEDYGMKAYGGTDKEWYEQVDIFADAVKGKTIDEVKKMVADGGKGNDEVVNAGCTIAVSDFVKAIEKAVKNATDSQATASAELKLGIVSTQSDVKDAADDANGTNEVSTTFVAAATDKGGKVVAMATDALSVAFTFDTKGVTDVDTSLAITTKLEAGDNYGMKAYGGADKEWYEQADEFNKVCIGKSADEISSLVASDGKGDEALIDAGCTIDVTDMVKAAIKAVK